MLYYDPCFKQLASLLYSNFVPSIKGKQQHIAYQITITDKEINRPFYVEVCEDGKVNIEPYEYNDKDVEIKATFETLMLILSKQMSIDKALAFRKIEVRGNMAKALLLKKFL